MCALTIYIYIHMFNGFCSTWTLLLSIHFALLVVLLFEIIVCFGSDWWIDWQWEGLTSLMPHQALLAIQIHDQLSWKDWKPQDEQVWGPGESSVHRITRQSLPKWYLGIPSWGRKWYRKISRSLFVSWALDLRNHYQVLQECSVHWNG